jgi:SAM-dependent methyltransferase
MRGARFLTRLRDHGIFMAVRALRLLLRRNVPLPVEDRRVLEKQILPYFAQQPEYGRVLFVGCDWYTKPYETLFASREYWTLEPDPRRRRFGAERHVTDGLENLAAHFGPGYFDLILCNGVVGWGLNEAAAVEAAFEACATRLRVGGVLVLGWNDVPERRPYPLEESTALGRLAPLVLPPLGVARHETATRGRHVFAFLQKPAPGRDA